VTILRRALPGHSQVEGTTLFIPTRLSDSTKATFRKSSQCTDGACVEVSVGDEILVRSSLAPGNVVAFSKAEWRAFVAGVRLGEFDSD